VKTFAIGDIHGACRAMMQCFERARFDYKKDRLIVMVRDPFWLHAYWELTRATIDRAEAAMGQRWHGARPTLRVYQVATAGDPYANLGDLVVLSADIGDTLDASDWDAGTYGTARTLSTTVALGWKTVDVTDAVVADLASARPRSQFRIQFISNPLNGSDDWTHLEDGDNSHDTGNLPQLVVTYKR